MTRSNALALATLLAALVAAALPAAAAPAPSAPKRPAGTVGGYRPAVLTLKGVSLSPANNLTGMLAALGLPRVDLPFAVAPGTATPENFRPQVRAAISNAFPSFNSQLAAANQPPSPFTADFVTNGVLGALAIDPVRNPPSRRLERRLPAAFCAAFATVAVPGYLAAAAWFAKANDGAAGYATYTDDQLFFLRAALRRSPPNPSVSVYMAKMAPGFTKRGATMDAIMYYSASRGMTYAGTDQGGGKWTLGADFHDRTRILSHELVHVLQYNAAGSGIVPFAFAYMFDFCENGMKYDQISYEVTAKAVAASADPLYHPASHFKIWKARNLKAPLGFPVKAQIESKGVLHFDKGLLQVHPADLASTSAGKAKRYRHFLSGTAEHSQFIEGMCKPKQALNPGAKPCLFDNPPNICDPDWVAAYNAACAAKQVPETGKWAWSTY